MGSQGTASVHGITQELVGGNGFFTVLGHLLLGYKLEDGFLLVVEDCGGWHSRHEGFDTLSWSNRYPDALSQSLRACFLKKATKNTTHDKRSSLYRIVSYRIIDEQDLGLAPELNTLRWVVKVSGKRIRFVAIMLRR